jgi:hypothetical protein
MAGKRWRRDLRLPAHLHALPVAAAVYNFGAIRLIQQQRLQLRRLWLIQQRLQLRRLWLIQQQRWLLACEQLFQRLVLRSSGSH